MSVNPKVSYLKWVIWLTFCKFVKLIIYSDPIELRYGVELIAFTAFASNLSNIIRVPFSKFEIIFWDISYILKK